MHAKHIAALLPAAFALAALASDEVRPASDVEVWNEGVSAYLAGDTTNAVRVLRPLMLSRTHGPRAAEVVAKVAYDRAHTPGAEDALESLEEAAAAAQIALRAAPGDARANRNFTRAVEGLAELRETKRVNKVLESAQGRDPGSILGEAMRSARAIMDDAASCRTNAAERAVALADSMSMRADRLCDSWLQAKSAICQAVTNEEQSATISLQVDQARERTELAAKALGDLSDDAYAAIADSERDFTQFFKMTVLPPEAMREDLLVQSNALLGVEAFNGRDWQHEALDYTRAFRAKFPAWAQAYEQQAAADTNMPPFTAEAQARVAELSVELEKRQISSCENPAAATQEEALANIREILDLLPDQRSGAPQGRQQDKPQQGSDSGQPQEGDGSGQRQESEGDDSQEQGNEEGVQEENPEQDEGGDEEGRDGSEGEDEEEPGDKEVEALLKMAQERNDEHEAEKRARMRKMPLPPNERDW